MYRVPRPLLSFATIVALLAFLGGSASAAVATPAKHGGRHAHPKTTKARQAVRQKSKRRPVQRNRGTMGPAGSVGPMGPAGSAGPMGPAGPAGRNGMNGQNGAANAFESFRTTGYLALPTGGIAVLRLMLPAGSYALQSNMHLVQNAGDDAQRVTCNLTGPSGQIDQGLSDLGVMTAGRVAHADLALGGTLTLTSPGAVVVNCRALVDLQAGAQGRIVATQVANLTSAPTA